MRCYSPFEIDAANDTLAALGSCLTGLAVGDRFGPHWLRDTDGTCYPIYVSQRDLEFKFEVFSLAIPTLSALATRAPQPPEHFDAWPFARWTVGVLRRTEFIIEDSDIQDTFGEAPNVQSAVPPGQEPEVASAACEVAVGIVFTAEDGAQLLIGVDRMPFNTIVTQDAVEIDGFRQCCEIVELAEYVKRIR